MTDIAGERARLAAQGLQIITREQWGARQDYTSDRTVNRPAQWLFLHITVTADPADTTNAEAAACRQVEEIGQQRFGIGWSYNAGVMQSGRLYEGQPLTRRGAHTVNDKPNPNFPSGSLNYDARACALVQNVQDAVTDAQIDSAARWGAALRRSGEAIAKADWFGHRDVTAKSCPGDIAYARLGELNALTDYYTQYGLGPVTPTPEVPMGEFVLYYPANGTHWYCSNGGANSFAVVIDGNDVAKMKAINPDIKAYTNLTALTTGNIINALNAADLIDIVEAEAHDAAAG